MNTKNTSSTTESDPQQSVVCSLSDAELQDFITQCEKAADIARRIIQDRTKSPAIIENIDNFVEGLVVRELMTRLATFQVKGQPNTFPKTETISFDPKKPISFRNPAAGKVIQYMGQWGDGKHSFEVAYGDGPSVIETRNSDGRRFNGSGDDWADIVNINPEDKTENKSTHKKIKM